jgi:selenocysteine lyase/cysteine desulfurase
MAPPTHLDNAFTTLVPRQVIESIREYYTEYPSYSGTRSRHWLAEEVSDRIEGNPNKGKEGSRRILAEFIKAGSEKEIIFTLNTTHAINTVARGFPFQTGVVVLLTAKEHNSNLVPWLKMQKAGRIKVDFTGPKVLDDPRESDVTITVGDLTFAINRDLLDKARPIRLDFVEFGGRKGLQLTSRLPAGGCG